MDYVSGRPEPDREEVSEAAFVSLSELATSVESAPFTRAIVGRMAKSEGLYLDPYQPPPSTLSSVAYLLYLDRESL
jgi:hypothetical protein